MAYKVADQRGRVDLEIARFSWPFAKGTGKSTVSLNIYRWASIVLLDSDLRPSASLTIARDYSI